MPSGGEILRTLRRERAETIENIAMDAGITYKSLSKIETGDTLQPLRETVCSIMEALDQVARIKVEDWRAVFEAFGYRRPYPLPTDQEIKEACNQWQETYGHVAYPAYLVDYSQRLLDWNRFAPRLVGMRYNDAGTRLFKKATVFDLTFSLGRHLATIENFEAFVPSLLRVMKAEFQPYRDEPWYAKCIQDVEKKYPEFKRLWSSIPDDEVTDVGIGNAIPIVLHLPKESQPLTFQLVKIDFTGDPRFRVVQWMPVDEATMSRCLDWVREESRIR